MRLVPLRNTSTRPPDGERSPSRPRVLWIIYFFCTDRQATRTAPFRRVSGIAVEGVERHGCRESRDGPGMALCGVPLEWRWSERTRSEAQGRMQGQDLLVPFGATAKRNPPSRAEPMRQATRPLLALQFTLKRSHLNPTLNCSLTNVMQKPIHAVQLRTKKTPNAPPPVD